MGLGFSRIYTESRSVFIIVHLCSALVAMLIWAGPAPAQSKVPARPTTGKVATRTGTAVPAATPSLDVLVRRANDFWSLLARGDRKQASRYVDPLSREDFLVRPFPNFSNPLLTRLEPGASRKEVSVTVSVKRTMPPLPGIYDQSVRTRWVFTGGVWLVVMNGDDLTITPLKNPFELDGSKRKESDEKRAALRANLHFPKREIDLGTVRQGPANEFGVEYRLKGDQPVEVRLRESTIDIQRFVVDRLQPGARQFRMRFLTANYDGPFQGSFVLTVRQAGIEESFEFTLKGKVYTPFSVSPLSLKFSAGENDKEITIRNNSSVEARLDPLAGESNQFDVGPLPQNLAPGASCTLKVTRLADTVDARNASVIVIRLAQPVDGMNLITLPVEILSEPPK